MNVFSKLKMSFFTKKISFSLIVFDCLELICDLRRQFIRKKLDTIYMKAIFSVNIIKGGSNRYRTTIKIGENC